MGINMEAKRESSNLYKLLDTDTVPDFSFLFVGHWLQGELGEDRKDVGMMIKTFCTVFKSIPKDKRPGLVLKTSSAGFSVISRESIVDKVKAITEPFGEDIPQIYLLFGDLNPSELNELYNHPKMKAMVSFTKGEGYGRPLQEFAVTGKPIIVSKWSGHTDFLPEENTVYLDGELKHVHPSAQNQFLIKESKWFTVNYTQAAQKMFDVYTNYETHLEKSKPLTEKIKKDFSLDKMNEMFKDIFDRHVKVKEHIKLELPSISKL